VADVHARRFAQGVFGGLLIAVGFYILNAFLKGWGQDGKVTPLLAGWLPLAAFIIVVYFLVLRMERIRG
jgi:lipopolysaccharide export LptBFGC system permease protein LptF